MAKNDLFREIQEICDRNPYPHQIYETSLEDAAMMIKGTLFTEKEAMYLFIILENGAPMTVPEMIQQSEGFLEFNGSHVFMKRLIDRGVLTKTKLSNKKSDYYFFAEEYERIFRIWLLLKRIVTEIKPNKRP